MLFVGAKISHLGLLPQGQAECESRVIHMVRKMDELGFGNCTNHYECEAICPAEVSATFMALLYRDYVPFPIKPFRLVSIIVHARHVHWLGYAGWPWHDSLLAIVIAILPLFVSG